MPHALRSVWLDVAGEQHAISTGVDLEMLRLLLKCTPQDDPKYKAAMRTRNPEQRLRAFLQLCGSKRFDEETGAPQPAYKLDSMRIMAEFPKPKVGRGALIWQHNIAARDSGGIRYACFEEEYPMLEYCFIAER